MALLSSNRLWPYGVCFFLSGACSLVYQVIWLRLAFASFGVITPVISVVLSTFMLGLALGSWFAAWITQHQTLGSRRLALIAYGLLELAIAVGAFVVPQLLVFGEQLLLGLGEMSSSTYLLLSGLTIAASLLPWCVCMGATFPVMLSVIRERYPAEERSFSYLYSTNVLGAAFGALISALLLVELFGFTASVKVAGVLNAILGVVVILFAVKQAPKREALLDSRPTDSTEKLSASESSFAYTVLFWTGFSSLGMEVAWTRAFTRLLSTTIYAFALIISVYLFATLVGSDLYRKGIGRRVGLIPLNIFAWLIWAILLPVLLNDPRLPLSPIVPLISILPFCLLLGYLTPAILDGHCQGHPALVGKAYGVNLAGGVLGPLVTAYVLLPVLGVKNSILILGLPYLLLLWKAWRLSAADQRKNTLVAVTLAGLAMFVFAYLESRSLEDSWYEHDPAVKMELRRDYTASVVSLSRDNQKLLLVNGVGMTSLTPITKFMTHLPVAHFDGTPNSALVICFGMGTAYRSMLAWGIDTTVVELVKSVPEAFGFYFEDASKILALPHGDIVIDDGRRYLKRTSRQFDVITLDPPPPLEAAAVSLLYSKEFMRLVKERLSPHGIVQHWVTSDDIAAVRAVLAAVVGNFPYVRVFEPIELSGYHILASSVPIPVLSPAEIVAKMPKMARDDLVEWYPGREADQLWQEMLGKEVKVSDLLGSAATVPLTDDRPINEYFVLRRLRTWWKGST